MTTCPIYHQYRSLDVLYLFKIKSENNLILKIFDIYQKHLFKQTLSARDLDVENVYQMFCKIDLFIFLENLIQRKLLPKQYSLSSSSIKLEDCIQAAFLAIQQMKSKIFVEYQDLEDFTCPITLGVFREPVIDAHGHTFEKSAIEEALEVKNECPINRQPIHSLTPNRLVKQKIEDLQKRDPIPNFSLFKKENATLATTHLQLAQTYTQEGEYQGALENYAKAFQYTKKWKDYVNIPTLFEHLKEFEKATLAYFYLAQYQLEDDKTLDALQTLERCQSNWQRDLLLIKLYQLTEQPSKALQLTLQSAENLSKHNPEQAIALYKQLLGQNPCQFALYSYLVALLKNPQEQAHILLKGACHALQAKNYNAAERFCKNAKTHFEDSFIDELIFLDLLRKQERFSDIPKRLILLANAYESKKLFNLMLKAYKMLFQLEKKPEYCQKIITAYSQLKKVKPHWYIEWLSLLIKDQDWQQAEDVAKEALENVSEVEKLPLYENLETVYTNWHGHKLEDLWKKLGSSYLVNAQLIQAEQIYRKAFERFQTFDLAFSLADTLGKQGKTKQSVQVYYEASGVALLEDKMEKLDLCAREIKKIDPHMQKLDSTQRMHLLTQSQIFKLSSELRASRGDLQVTKDLFERRILSLERTEEAAAENLLRRIILDKTQWEKYFGDVGVEPPLPADIIEILESPCPFWPGKKVLDTHLLVLIPKTVNGQPFTLNFLEELVKNPKGGRCAIGFYGYRNIKEIFGCKAIVSSYWTLITKNVVFTKGTYFDQREQIENYSQQIGLPYEIPHAIEAATSILMHYAKTGEYLYNDVLASCQEQIKYQYQEGSWPLVVGNAYYYCEQSHIHIDSRFKVSDSSCKKDRVGCARKL